MNFPYILLYCSYWSLLLAGIDPGTVACTLLFVFLKDSNIFLVKLLSYVLGKQMSRITVKQYGDLFCYLIFQVGILLGYSLIKNLLPFLFSESLNSLTQIQHFFTSVDSVEKVVYYHRLDLQRALENFSALSLPHCIFNQSTVPP